MHNPSNSWNLFEDVGTKLVLDDFLAVESLTEDIDTVIEEWSQTAVTTPDQTMATAELAQNSAHGRTWLMTEETNRKAGMKELGAW